MTYTQSQYFNHKFETDVRSLSPFTFDSIMNWCSLGSFRALLSSCDAIKGLRRTIKTQGMLNGNGFSLTSFSTCDGFLCPQGSISAARRISSSEALGSPSLSISLIGW